MPSKPDLPTLLDVASAISLMGQSAAAVAVIDAYDEIARLKERIKRLEKSKAALNGREYRYSVGDHR